LEQAIADHPDDPAGYYHLGMWHASEQRPSDALAALDQTLALAGALPVPPVYLAPTYILKVASLIALGEHALALAVAPDAETVCKGEPDYWFNIGIAHQAVPDHDSALAAFRRCLALRGAQPYMAEHGTRGWKTCLAMAASFDALDNRPAAMAARWESLRDFPGQPVLHGKLWAQAWLDGDDAGKAECHDLWQALPTQARTTIAALAIDTLATMGAWEPAEILARDLLGQMPPGERSAIVARLAELFRRRGAAMERAALLMACQQEPGVLRLMADDQRQQGDWVGYERSCRQLIAAGEDLADAQAGLGAALLRQGDADGADAALQAAISHGSTDASVWNNLGVIALGRQQVEAAEGHFRTAVRLQPDHFSANLNLVRTAWWRQDMPDAQTQLATAVGVLEGLIVTGPSGAQQAAVADLEALQRYFRGWDMRRTRQAEMAVPPGTDEFLATVFRAWQVIGGRLAKQRNAGG
jgi:tetratricopeptide (TPR) repeat protein